jgi:RHS repeat-associated protein
VAALSNPVALGKGESVCAVISGGSIECWGRNGDGDLGDGTQTGPEKCGAEACSRTPVRVSGITNATAVVGGVGFACALLETHHIECWGFGEDGELGNGHFETSLTPVEVSGITNAVAIAAGEVEACAVLSDHTVKCWGSNGSGALGDGKTQEEQKSSNVPVAVSGITNAVGVTAANEYVCAVLESGEARCWGRNRSGDLGDGKTQKEQESSDVPVAVSGTTTATSLTANLNHTCALLKSGKVECWGDDEFGDLGNGHSFEPSATPVAVSGISTATQLASGYWHTCAVLSSGGVACWGDNLFGELGNGSAVPEESSTPVGVSGITGATTIAANEFTTVAYGPSFPVGEVIPTPTPEELWALENPGEPFYKHSCTGDPVNCATGNLAESQTDFTVGGRGVPLALTRTYNAQSAAAGKHGAFGYGWTSSFSDHLEINPEAKTVTVVQANGSTVTFAGTGEPGALTAPRWAQSKLVLNTGGSYTYTLPGQETFGFDKEGHLLSESDRDGNTTTLTYNEAGQLTTITDPTSRTLKLAYNGEGLIESAEDAMKHVVKYAYESGNLKSVTQPAEAGLRWQFKYDASHELTELTDGRGGKVINEYDVSHRVTKQEDPAGHKLKFEYESHHIKITNEATGSVTNEVFTGGGEPESITRGFGTASATTESFVYDGAGEVTSAIDGNFNLTKYTYDEEGNRRSQTNPDGDETQWSYNSTHDVLTMTTPKGETTTIKREAHGNPETIERPAPGAKTQVTKYKYKTTGELESVEDPLKRVRKYEYDTHGNRTVEVDPLSNKRTREYNEDSQEIATVSPRGNVTGGKPAEFTTKIERDAQGRPLTVTDPLKHTTKYKYDGDGNVEKVTDGNSHTTTYTYNGDNEPIKVEAPNKAITETEYDGASQVVKQIDGNKHATEYKRNAVEEVTEVIDPLKHKTLKEYNAAGSLKKLEDPAKRTTTYKYDPANRLEEVSYSSGSPAAIKYEYDKNGDRTKMTDGTGTTIYTYDQLDRMTESENGHKEVIKYEYDLANEQTKITYPNTKAVTRAFDKDSRLEKVTDWNTKATKFSYNPDSELTLTSFPTEPKNEDKYAYNDADQTTEVKMLKGTETLASLVYTRDNDGQVKKTTAKGLPGTEITENTYDENSRLAKYGSTEYKYDSANNPTKEGSSTNTYNEDNELEKGTGMTYAYDELGERTKTTSEKGPVTTYGYDQAGDLTSVERPKEGEVAEIKDTYAYDGNGLRASQTISGTTSYVAWDMSEGLPLILSDGTNSYIYGPSGLPVEQINGEGTPTYLHHDQQGSTRLLTGSAGTVTGSTTFDAYGNKTGSTGSATTPFGYDAQYTSTDTGLIYLRARTYDPVTAQFLTVDRLASLTRAPYAYGGDDPLNLGDPTGYEALPLPIEGPGGLTLCADPLTAALCVAAGGYVIKGEAEALYNSIAGEEGGSDEGEAELHTNETARGNCGEISPNFNNPAESPGPGWEWRGKGPEGSSEGSWFNPETKESLHPDLEHGEPAGPHYDYKAPDGSRYRIYPDGRIEPNG